MLRLPMKVFLGPKQAHRWTVKGSDLKQQKLMNSGFNDRIDDERQQSESLTVKSSNHTVD